MIKLAILDYEKGKLHTYNEDYLNKLSHYKKRKNKNGGSIFQNGVEE